MADVAAAAGVSMQTVSRALRFPDTVTRENRKVIDEAIRKTHYVHNLAASHLASHKSNTVAAVIPTLSASVFAETMQHFSDVLHDEGYRIFLGNTDYRLDREEEVIRSLLGRRPDGVFLIGAHHTRTSVTLLKRAGIPVVEGWDMTEKPIDRLVGFSNSAAIAAMARCPTRESGPPASVTSRPMRAASRDDMTGPVAARPAGRRRRGRSSGSRRSC